MSHQLDCTWFGLAPAGHHLTSLALHAASTVLLFLWLSAATGFLGRSAFVALAFGLHPVHVESVAWAAERKDVLSTFFWMLTLLAYGAYAKKPGVARYCLVAALLAAGLMAKPMLVTVPILLLLLDWWPLQRTGVRRLVLEKLPLLALSALSCAATVWAQRQSGAVSNIEQLPIALRLSNAAVSYVRYLGKTVWPVNLAVFYPYPMQGIALWKVAASMLFLAAVTGLALAARRRHPWLATGWGWYLLTLLPVIGIMQVGMQSMADRYLYVPMIGLLIAVAWEGGAWAERWRAGGRVIEAVAGLALAACAFLSWQQCRVWKDGLTLFTHAVAVTRDNFVAHDNLGVELDRRGRFDEALVHYRETLRIKPGDRNGEQNYAQASFAKGERLFAAGKPDEALALFREGIRYRPRNAMARSLMGKILTAQQKLPAAAAEFRRAIEIDLALGAAHMGLAVALAWSGHPAEARREFEETVRYEPSNMEARYDLGLVLAAMGDDRAALKSFDAAVRLKPDFGPAHAARAESLFALGRYHEAGRAVLVARALHTEVDPGFAAALAARIRR
jgi:tetratricopeptide (TPR) repeat protein